MKNVDNKSLQAEWIAQELTTLLINDSNYMQGVDLYCKK